MFERLSDLFLTLLVILLLACATFGLSYIIFMPIVLLFNKYKDALPTPCKFLEKRFKNKIVNKRWFIENDYAKNINYYTEVDGSVSCIVLLYVQGKGRVTLCLYNYKNEDYRTLPEIAYEKIMYTDDWSIIRYWG